jgi:hypothetical protein
MTANEVIALARAGELRQLSTAIKDDTTTLIGFINLGMLELYKRFVLRTDEAIITLVDGKVVYSLDGTDTDVEMGDGDFMYLISAYGESDKIDDYTFDDKILPINEEDNIFSINTISYNKIQIPLITEGAFISIIYASKPTKVTSANLDTELDIPDQFVKPLLHYLGYEAHGSMDGNVQDENNAHYLRFEASCNKLRELGIGIAPDDISMGSRIRIRGFI